MECLDAPMEGERGALFHPHGESAATDLRTQVERYNGKETDKIMRLGGAAAHHGGAGGDRSDGETARGLAELGISLIREGDEVEEEGDVADGVLWLGLASEWIRGGV